MNPEYTKMEPAVPDWLYKKIRKTEDRKIEMEPAVPDPAVNPEYTEMELAVPDWLYRKIRNRKTEDRNRNWWMEVEPDEESVLSEEESGFTLLPQYRSWATSSYVRKRDAI